MTRKDYDEVKHYGDVSKINGADANEVFHWWVTDGVLPGQLGFEDLDGAVKLRKG